MWSRPPVVRLALLLLALPGPLAAQTPQASVSGIVTDATGAVLPGVRVTARNLATGQQTVVATNHRGLYVLAAMPVGEYSIEAEKSGFKKHLRGGVTLTTSATVALDVVLAIGEASETVTVTADAPLLQARSSDVSQLIESRAVEDLPLGDRRTLNVVMMTGAAVFVQYDSGSKPNFSLAGGRTQSQMFWIDGGTGQNMRLGIGQVDLDPPVETVQEVKVVSNNYAAEYGGSAGGVIIATTKSGTNTFRGSLFEYFRNDALDAANFFAPVDAGGRKSKAPLRYNVFGGTIGGPIRKDRTFFFLGYEGTRRREGLIRTLTVPSDAQRRGDFSQTLNAQGARITIYDPATTRVEGGRTVRTPFPDNRIPLERLDPVAVRLMQFYPLPNRPPDNVAGANNFRANFNQVLTRNNVTAKLDHQFAGGHKLNLRYLYNSDDRDFTSPFPERAADTNTLARRHQHYFYAGYTRLIRPTVLNELRYTYSDRINHEQSFGLGGGWPAKLGLRGVPDDAFPTFTVAGFATLGAGTHERRQFPIRQHQLVDNLSITQGRHTLKAGVEVRPSFNFEVNRPSVSGQFGFTTLPTGQPGTAGTGSAFASLLLGFPNSVTLRETEALERSSWYLAAFVQDTWTLHPDLTLNIGMRWETDTPIHDKNDRMNGFEPDAINPVSGTRGSVRFAGVDGWPSNPYATDLNNFGPRFGFAWRPFGQKRTLVRGGLGVFFAHPFDHGAPSSASLGFEKSASLTTPDNGITAPFFLRDGVPALRETAASRDAGFGAVPVDRPTTTAVTFYERDRGTGYAMQLNFGVQHQLAGAMLLDASYVGNLSRKLPSPNLSINQIPPERMGPAASQRDRPFPQFSNVSTLFPTLGVVNYHAFVLRLERRFASGVGVLASYTWSRFLNDTDEGGSALGDSGVYSDLYNRRRDYGPSSNDIPHRFTLSGVYELPVGRGKPLLAEHWLRHVFGGWSLGVLALAQAGPPFTVTTQTNTANAFSAGALRADVVRDPKLPKGQRTLARWFDAEAFAQPRPFAFGNGSRGILRGDGTFTVDLSVLKNVTLPKDKRLQLRVEMFNALNHPNFGLPGHSFGAPGFGVVSDAPSARTLQLGARLAF